MNRATPPLAAVCAVTVLALAGAASATETSVIRITDRELSYRRIDQGPPGAGPGDIEIAWQALYNRRITTKALGHSELLCTFLTRRSRSCTATYFLPKGKIVVEGVIGSRLLFELPVIGGTGIYASSRGSLVVTTTTLDPRKEILLFRLNP
ncbi:MAG TPA: hypothetical protein VLN26_17475 [Gaiellaceae bacterium]|nr:hypothetical protein [Gaiellaceae bacterium]